MFLSTVLIRDLAKLNLGMVVLVLVSNQTQNIKFKIKILKSIHNGVNFINVLWAAFARADPESAKKTDNVLHCLFLFCAFGIWCQFYQRFMRSFYARRSRKHKTIQLSHQYLFTLLKSACVKAVCRMLMKLRPGHGLFCLFKIRGKRNLIRSKIVINSLTIYHLNYIQLQLI